MLVHVSWEVLAWWFWGIAMLNIALRSYKVPALRIVYPISATAMGFFWSWVLT